VAQAQGAVIDASQQQVLKVAADLGGSPPTLPAEETQRISV
jgi:hypothetical protein